MLRIIHLSDLHLQSEKISEKQGLIINALFKDLDQYLIPENLNKNGLTPVLFFTGDAIDSGGHNFSNPEKAFDKFNEVILKPLLDRYKILENRIFFVPGNHDVSYRAKVSHTFKIAHRRTIDSPTKKIDCYKDFMKIYKEYKEIDWMAPYLNFERDFYKNYPDAELTSLVNSFKIRVADKTIGISCFNSAWQCYDDIENGAPLILGLDVLTQSRNFLANTDYSMCLIHHPFNFFYDEEFLRKELDAYTMFFCGHIHSDESDVKVNAYSASFWSTSQSVIGSSGQIDYHPKFGYKIIDFYPEKCFKVHFRTYNERGHHFTNDIIGSGTNNGIKQLGIDKKEQSENNEIADVALIRQDIDDVMNESIEYIKTAKSLKVVGVGRQYTHEIDNLSLISKYYDAIEKRFEDASNQFNYQRITVLGLKPKFLKHLENCFKKSTNKNKIEVLFLSEMEMKLTYYIIDDKFIALNLYQRDNEENIWDSPYAFCSKDKETINQFIRHFDTVWQVNQKDVIANKDRFNKIVPFDEETLKSIKTITTIIKRLPKGSMRQNRAFKELEQTTKRIEGIDSYNLEIPYKADNGKMLNVFSDSLKFLGAGGKYNTISFYEFWKATNDGNQIKFREANYGALKKEGVSIYRVYVINRNKIGLSEYWNSQSPILMQHEKMVLDNPERYNFKVYFVDEGEYAELIKHYKNFALWECNQEKVLFKPSYELGSEGNFLVSSSVLTFIDDNITSHQSKETNNKEYKDFEEKFDLIKNQQERQFLSTNEEEFLKKCGVRDIDNIT